MNNRLVLGLAVGGGYLLGRTKKAKLAFGIGTLVMGKKLQLSPRALAEFATQQLQNNPQLKVIGDQLRGDLRGVGKAATGALVTRQVNGLADRLHDRTLGVQDRISGVSDQLPDVPGKSKKKDAEPQAEDQEQEQDQERDEGREEQEDREERKERPAPRRAKKTASASSGTAKKTARSTAKKTTASRAPARKTAAKKTASRGGRDHG
ncbi:DNA primase [Streptomyces sp. NPDC050738]|uniref:DNA primase n=1 Tax=Streptomyces sp. NPDC050738 TaxID=3154744 RepID=UPI00343BCBF6